MRPTPLPLTPAMRKGPVQIPADMARQIDALLPELRRCARQLCATWSEADTLVQTVLMSVWAQADTMDSDPEMLRIQVFETLRDRAGLRGIRSDSVA